MPGDNIRCFRNRIINFDTTMQLVSSGNRIAAKREIEKNFSGLTKAEIGYGILKLIENSGAVPSDDELTSYITQKEEAESKRKLRTSIESAHVTKLATQNATGKATTCIPRCPTCGSTDLTRLGIMARAIDGAVFGKLSVEGRAQFRCNNCGYMW